MRLAALLLMLVAIVGFLRASTAALPPEKTERLRPEGLVWGDRVFASEREFAAWLDRRGGSYSQWLSNHPGAAPWEPAPAKPPSRPLQPAHSADGGSDGRSAGLLAAVGAALLVGLLVLIRSGHLIASKTRDAIERLSPPPRPSLLAAPAGHSALAFVRAGQPPSDSKVVARRPPEPSPEGRGRSREDVAASTDQALEPALSKVSHAAKVQPPRRSPPTSPPKDRRGRAKVASTPQPANEVLPPPVSPREPGSEHAPPSEAPIPVDAGGSAAEPTGRAESGAAAEAPSAPPVAEISCEIAYWRGYFRSLFYARLVPGEQEAIATSPLMRSHSPVPERTEECLEAYDALVLSLLASGWEPSGQGAEWFSARFTRRVS